MIYAGEKRSENNNFQNFRFDNCEKFCYCYVYKADLVTQSPVYIASEVSSQVDLGYKDYHLMTKTKYDSSHKDARNG